MKQAERLAGRRGRIVLLLAVVVCAVMGGIIAANSFHKTIQSGEHVAAQELTGQVFRVAEEGAENEGGQSVLRIFVEGTLDVREVAVAAFRTKQITFYDRQGAAQATFDQEVYRHFRLIPLEEYSYDAAQGVLTVCWSVDDFFNNSYLFLGSAEVLRRQQEFWGRATDIYVGVLVLMLVYSLSLAAHKKDERYLTTFAVYIGITLLMSVLNMGFIESGWLYELYSKCVPALIMCILCVEVSTLIGLLGAPQRWWTRLFTSWKWIAALVLLYYGVSQLNIMLFKEISRFLVILAGFSVVVEAMDQGTPRAGTVFLGYVVSEAINLVPMGINLGFYEDGLVLALFRTARLYSLPFAFACMFFINWKFANRFKETERLSAELEQTNRSLDRIVQERTAAIVEQMQKRHSLMLNIFHDLRSPLFVLKGCLQILFDEAEDDPEEQEQMRAVAQEKLTYLTDLTENLFFLAKLEDEKFLLSCAPVDVFALLRELCASYAVAAEQKERRFSFHIEKGSAVVWGDGMRLKQVINNIFENALRYTQPGGSIELRAVREEERVLVSLRDNGPGIPPEKLESVFERYYRADDRAKHSSGLGLAIARGIVEKHNGTIGVQSEVGRGSCFTVTLPLLKGKEEQA